MESHMTPVGRGIVSETVWPERVTAAGRLPLTRTAPGANRAGSLSAVGKITVMRGPTQPH